MKDRRPNVDPAPNKDPGSFFRADGADLLISVRAVPGASRAGIAGVLGDRLKVRVSAPPEGGRANRAVCAVVAAALNVRPSAVSIESGLIARDKTLRVRGLRDPAAAARLLIPGKA